MDSLRNRMDEWVADAVQSITGRLEAHCDRLARNPRIVINGIGTVRVTLSRKCIHPMIPWVDFELTPLRDWFQHDEQWLDPGVPVFGDLRVAGDVDMDLFVELAVAGLRRRVRVVRELHGIGEAPDFGCALFAAFDRWRSLSSPWRKSSVIVMDPDEVPEVRGELDERKIELSVWDVGVEGVADGGVDLCVPTAFLRGSAWFRDKPEMLDRVWNGGGLI